MWVFIICFIIAIPAVFISDAMRKKKSNDIVQSLKEDLKRRNFQITKQQVIGDNKYLFLIDEYNRKWAIMNPPKQIFTIYNFSDLVEYEIIENGNSILQGRVGSALMGGLFFGELGAFAGSARSRKIQKNCESISVRIIVNYFNSPQIIIPLLSITTTTESSLYKEAIENARIITAMLAIIKLNIENEKYNNTYKQNCR